MGARARRGLSAALPTTRSSELYHRALELLPGGVNSPVRAMRAIGRDPIFIAWGEGPKIVDVDGNEYVDWVGSWGPLIAGHAHPAVVDAVASAATQGTSFGAPTPGEVELAAEVRGGSPRPQMMRMTSSGTEATMSAIRLARAATGRDLVLKFAGAYHGHVDGLLAQAGSGLATQGIPASPGVPAALAQTTVIVALERCGSVEQRQPRRIRWRRSWPSRYRRTWASSRRRRGSWSCCVSAPTKPVRCSYSTR